jgi:hypothetical protein
MLMDYGKMKKILTFAKKKLIMDNDAKRKGSNDNLERFTGDPNFIIEGDSSMDIEIELGMGGEELS